ncbi:MAG TPA: hypothetical protein VMW65_03820 [Chloroflexota bacterium]|nr:hypothetical protein [Chloroflexota bacterium]
MIIDVADEKYIDALRVYAGGQNELASNQPQIKRARPFSRKNADAVPGSAAPSAARTEIIGTAYDTAWLASVPSAHDQNEPRYPQCLSWLVDQQHADGSWGGSVRYEHDRVISTLAALTSLATYGRRTSDVASIAAGTRYLWQHGHLIAHEPMELVGFELLLPAMVRRAQQAGIAVPPNLNFYQNEREEKLRLIPAKALYSAKTTISHSLEFLGDDAQVERLRAVQSSNGAIGNSPATTAFYLALTNDVRAEAYLDSLLDLGSDAAPVLYPCETFELLWAAYPLSLVGVPARRLLSPTQLTGLRKSLAHGGISLSPTFPVADADDTAVALILLNELGHTVDPSILQAFASANGYFVSFPLERHSSVGVNLHVLHALLRVPGYPDRENVIDRLLDYFEAQQIGGSYWLDKWHISPYYATAHALRVFAELPPSRRERVEPLVARAREWLRQTQMSDGQWGFYAGPTAEETAYAVLALSAEGWETSTPGDRQRCLAALRHLSAALATDPTDEGQLFPPLWIDKCLYAPSRIVRATIEAACIACLNSWPMLSQSDAKESVA